MHQFKDGRLGNIFPTELNSDVNEEMRKKFMETLADRLTEPLRNPNIKATLWGTKEELEKIKNENEGQND